MESLIGQTLGHYRIAALLGEGGMGAVFKAYDATLQRDVAIKVLHPHIARQKDFQGHFLREARTHSDVKRQTLRLAKARATPTRRHVKIRQAAKPHCPAWKTYFEARVGQHVEEDLQGGRKLVQLWMEQMGHRPTCDQQITRARGWNLHHLHWRVKGGTEVMANLVLLHPSFHRQVHDCTIAVAKPRPVNGTLAKA